MQSLRRGVQAWVSTHCHDGQAHGDRLTMGTALSSCARSSSPPSRANNTTRCACSLHKPTRRRTDTDSLLVTRLAKRGRRVVLRCTLTRRRQQLAVSRPCMAVQPHPAGGTAWPCPSGGSRCSQRPWAWWTAPSRGLHRQRPARAHHPPRHVCQLRPWRQQAHAGQ